YFFFQAEDGIRDRTVTGVQTCALPIFVVVVPGLGDVAGCLTGAAPDRECDGHPTVVEEDREGVRAEAECGHCEARLAEVHGGERSEERRVGKECRDRWVRGPDK